MAGRAWQLCLRPGRFRHYLALMLTGSIVTSSFAAFTIYYLKAVHSVPSSRLMLFTAAQFGGQIVGTWSIRHLIDAIPLPRFFQIAVTLTGIVDLFWIVTPSFGRDGWFVRWTDLAAPLAIGGVWIAVYIWILRGKPLLAGASPDDLEEAHGHG